MAKQKFFTKEDYDSLAAELEYLKTTGRNEIAEKIKVARSFGDLSENAEYDEAMNEQAKMEATIAKLENDLQDAVILDEGDLKDSDVIDIGFKVTLLDLEENEEVTYKILSKGDIDNGIISDQSPVGAALIGKKTGDIVDVKLPSEAIVQYKVLSFSK